MGSLYPDAGILDVFLRSLLLTDLLLGLHLYLILLFHGYGCSVRAIHAGTSSLRSSYDLLHNLFHDNLDTYHGRSYLFHDNLDVSEHSHRSKHRLLCKIQPDHVPDILDMFYRTCTLVLHWFRDMLDIHAFNALLFSLMYQRAASSNVTWILARICDPCVGRLACLCSATASSTEHTSENITKDISHITTEIQNRQIRRH